MAISLAPRDSSHDLRSFLQSKEQPPKLSPADMHLLDFYNSGISVVNEALKGAAILHQDYRGLSRAASHLAVERMAEHPLVLDNARAYRKYLEAKKMKEQRIRKRCDDAIIGTAHGYRPFVAGELHIWFWDDKDKTIAYATMSDAQMPCSMLFGFIADVLSDMTELGSVTDDLRAEYQQVLWNLDVTNAVITRIVENLTK